MPARARLGGARRRGRASPSSFLPVRRARAARRVDEPARAGLAAAADREPRRVALHDVRPPGRDLLARLAERRRPRRPSPRSSASRRSRRSLALWIAFARGPATRRPVPALLRGVRSARSSRSARCSRRSSCSGSCRSCRSSAAGAASPRRVLLTAALVLTQVWFPQRYWDYADSFHLAGVVLARDLVLVALLAVLVLPLAACADGPSVLVDLDADGRARRRAAVRSCTRRARPRSARRRSRARAGSACR